MSTSQEPAHDQPTDEARLRAIRVRLAEMGATAEFRAGYHATLSGKCVEEGCLGCSQHARGVATLPAGLMCRAAYEEKLGELRGASQQLRTLMGEHRVQWDQLRREEQASGFLKGEGGVDCQVRRAWWLETARRLLTPGAFQALATKRRKELEQAWSHHMGLAQRVKGERYALLRDIRPVDAAAWHRELGELLDEEADVMERLRVGRLVEPIAPRWSLGWRGSV
jgi:hypothetical protein